MIITCRPNKTFLTGPDGYCINKSKQIIIKQIILQLQSLFICASIYELNDVTNRKHYLQTKL